MRSRKLWMACLLLLAIPCIAQAPQALSIIINGVPLQGKALYYKNRVYVPLEDVARATGGEYAVDSSTGVIHATVLTPTAGRKGEVSRPYLKVVYERKYTMGSNARVLATIVNQGPKPASNVEVLCTFKDGVRRELGASVQNLGSMAPGERRTVEFRLFEAANTPSGFVGAPPYDQIYIDGVWTRVSYELTFNYQ